MKEEEEDEEDNWKPSSNERNVSPNWTQAQESSK